MAIHARSSSYIAFTAADWIGELAGLAVGKPTGRTDGLPNIKGELVGMLLGLTEGERAGLSKVRIYHVRLRRNGRPIQGNKVSHQDEHTRCRPYNLQFSFLHKNLMLFLTFAVCSSDRGSWIKNRRVHQTILR